MSAAALSNSVTIMSSFGRTLFAAVGVDNSVITTQITSGHVITPALA